MSPILPFFLEREPMIRSNLNSQKYFAWLVLALATAILTPAGAMAFQPPAARALEKKKTFRKLAPGVETTIPIQWKKEEVLHTHDAVDLLAIPNLSWDPHNLAKSRTIAEMSKRVNFRSQNVWNLEFTFKPMRMVRVDVPQPNGKMQRKLIWYMVYRVKYKDGKLVPVKQSNGTYAVEMRQNKSDKSIRFFPEFTLECPKLSPPKAYPDHLIPVAVSKIIKREDAARTLLNTVQISQKHVPFSTKKIDRSLWGVVTWEDIDPETDFFSVYIRGLTNAYRWQDAPDKLTPGDPPGTGRTFTEKTLKLNFWRPGDRFDAHEKEIRYGSPEDVDHEWIWRAPLPNPLAGAGKKG